MPAAADPDRRDLLKRIGVGAAAWTVPTILSVQTAAAQSGGGTTTTTTGPPPSLGLFDYTGGNRPPLLQPLHTNLASANGLAYTSGSTLPANLAGYAIVVLSAHTDLFSASDLDLIAGVLAAGKTLLYETDASSYWESYPGAGGSTAAVLNQVATRIGSTISDLNLTWDTGRRCDITTYLDADPLTAGLTRLGYGYTSALSFSPPARRLFRGITTTGDQPNQVVGCAETIGPGTFVALADTDVVSDFTEAAGCATVPETTQFRQNIGS